MEGRQMKMLMQTLSQKGFILTFFVFFILFIICIIIGSAGPRVYEYQYMTAWGCPSGLTYYDPVTCTGIDMTKNGSIWSGEVKNLDRLNQELELEATIHNLNPSQVVKGTINVAVSLEGRDSSGLPWNIIKSSTSHERKLVCYEGYDNCNALILANVLFVKYSSYRFNVSFDFAPLGNSSFVGDIDFDFSYVGHKYTLFELWFRFTFLVITFFVMVSYFYRMKPYSYSDWTFEQKWGAGLLFGLLAYNNPFYPMELLANGWFPIFLNRLLYATFIVLLLFFWLILFDGIRREATTRNFQSFYLPKVLLLGAFWIVGITVYTWYQLHQNNDPIYTATNDLPGYMVFQIALLVLIIAYTFWLVYATCRTCGDIKTLPYLGVRIKFFGVYTLLIILTVVGGLIFGAGTSANSAAEFLSFLALFNLYIYTLAFLYTPSTIMPIMEPVNNPPERIGMVRLDEDEESQVEMQSTQEEVVNLN